jgi:hypothetical protein
MTLGFAIAVTAKQVPGQPAAKFGREVMIKLIRIVVVIVKVSYPMLLEELLWHFHRNDGHLKK